jgi:hypothetical protein
MPVCDRGLFGGRAVRRVERVLMAEIGRPVENPQIEIVPKKLPVRKPVKV